MHLVLNHAVEAIREEANIADEENSAYSWLCYKKIAFFIDITLYLHNW